MMALLKVARTKFGQPTSDTLCGCRYKQGDTFRNVNMKMIFKPQTEWMCPDDFPDLVNTMR